MNQESVISILLLNSKMAYVLKKCNCISCLLSIPHFWRI